MRDIDLLEGLYIGAAFLFHVVLIVHFAMRGWRFAAAIRSGWLVYALAIPFAVLSTVQLADGRPWWLWLSGFLFAAWASFGYLVEYVMRLEWRSPVRWDIFIPYVGLYLATAMLYWWPLAQLSRPLWFVAAALFAVSTLLNVRSHPGEQATIGRG
jgi:hypothetical protein